jgi:hypothetical protein
MNSYFNKEKQKMNLRSKKCLLVSLVTVITLLTSSAAFADNDKITKQEVLTAQQEWSNGLVDIGKAYTNKGDYKNKAENLVSNLYAYDYGQVLFKPTKASVKQFRTTKEGAVSYFVGHNKKYTEDKGFALEPWTKVQFNNADIFINNNVAMTMGQYTFTPLKGEPVDVEYTFVYEKEKDGKVKIVLHHSSLPYSN